MRRSRSRHIKGWKCLCGRFTANLRKVCTTCLNLKRALSSLGRNTESNDCDHGRVIHKRILPGADIMER